MQTVLIVIHLMIVLALVGVVLIQRSEGGGLGIGGGSGFMSARGTANALTRTTGILAALFFVTSLGLGILSAYGPKSTDILNRVPTTTTGEGNLLDSLNPKNATPKPVPADPNAIPLGGDESGAATTTPDATTPAATTPAATTPAATPADPITTPATDAKPATEEKPAQQQ
jgi:preprotein translocase subunit SecG